MHQLTIANDSPYEVLDITYTATEADVKRQYRKKALLIHPDKFKHENVDEVSSGYLHRRHVRGHLLTHCTGF